MKKRGDKKETVVVRLDAKDKKALEAEGAVKGLDLSAYIRYLLYTHPERKK